MAGHERSALEIAEVVGCLKQGPASTWMLTNSSVPSASETQATSSAEVKAAAARPSGSREYQLLGAGAFNPTSNSGQKVAVKGVLIEGAKPSRLNVTSLQTLAAACF